MGHTVTTKQSVTTLARASDDISNVDPITVVLVHVSDYSSTCEVID